MNKNHFDIMEKEIGKIKLLRMEFVELDKIIQFPAVEFNATEDSYLMCSLALHVFNPEMTYLGNEFDVRMILNNNLQDENANKFTFRVSSAEHTVRVYDTFTLEPGQNMSRVWGFLIGSRVVRASRAGRRRVFEGRAQVSALYSVSEHRPVLR